MMTIEINEQELRNYVNELIALDSEVTAETNEINNSVNEFLRQLADSPVELLGEITQNRHSRKQFVTSTQDYDLVNVNFKRVCNYIVLCKNVWGLDRMFQNHYFDRT